MAAQILIDQTAKAMGWPDVVRVKFTGRDTTQRWGTYDSAVKLIAINRLGENYGTVLHELAHFKDSSGKHGGYFKHIHEQLIEMWE